MICFSCEKETGFTELVGRRDECPHCSADARVCKNCEFYDPRCENECKEPSAERVTEKDRSNFCDFFQGNKRKPGEPLEKKDLRAAAEQLFKK